MSFSGGSGRNKYPKGIWSAVAKQIRIQLLAKSLILRVYDILARHTSVPSTANEENATRTMVIPRSFFRWAVFALLTRASFDSRICLVGRRGNISATLTYTVKVILVRDGPARGGE
jgi:hypothetical protein